MLLLLANQFYGLVNQSPSHRRERMLAHYHSDNYAYNQNNWVFYLINGLLISLNRIITFQTTLTVKRFLLLATTLVALSSIQAHGQVTEASIREELNSLEVNLEKAQQAEDDDSALRYAIKLRTVSAECLDQQISRLEKFNKANVENSNSPLPISIGQGRQESEKEQKAATELLEFCKNKNKRAISVVTEITQKAQSELSAQLRTKNPNVFSLITEAIRADWPWVKWNQTQLFPSRYHASELTSLGMVFFISVLGGTWLRRQIKQRYQAGQKTLTSNQLLQQAFALNAPLWLPLYGVTLIVVAQTNYQLDLALNQLLLFICALISVAVTWHWIVILSKNYLPDTEAELPSLSILLLFILISLSYFIFYNEFLSFSTPRLAQIIHVILFSIIFINLLISFRQVSLVFAKHEFSSTLYRIGSLIIVLMWLGEILGFHNLVQYLLYGFSGSLLVWIFYFVSRIMIRDALNYLEFGDHRFLSNLRGLMGIQGGESWPGLLWIRFFLTLVIIIVALLALMFIWDLSATSFAFAVEVLIDGFDIGQFHITPIKLLFSIFIVALLMMAARTMKNAISASLADNSSLDPSGKEAVTTLVGYLGIGLVILIGLTIAGFDLTSLAFIAGALSLGLGFGLQNIVNNFVSGIILLFERPVRRGDWIRVGSTEGRVIQIKVRSTEIRTFDGADVVVPNSELISQQVINMTLRDIHGRVIIPVGVAYGSDVELVNKLLLSVAEEHPLILKSITDKLPIVLFRGFGDSALLFELRVFIGDVSKILKVASDLNFSIEQKFRQNQIQIPFPQRDLHLRSMPPHFGTEANE